MEQFCLILFFGSGLAWLLRRPSCNLKMEVLKTAFVSVLLQGLWLLLLETPYLKLCLLFLAVFFIMDWFEHRSKFRFFGKFIRSIFLLTLIGLILIKPWNFSENTWWTFSGLFVFSRWSLILLEGGALSFFSTEGFFAINGTENSKSVYEKTSLFLIFTIMPIFVWQGPLARFSEISWDYRFSEEKWLEQGLKLIKAIFKLTTAQVISSSIDSLAEQNKFLETLGFSFFLYFQMSGFANLIEVQASLCGFSVPNNFLKPFKARNVREFWNRWHSTFNQFLRVWVILPLTFVSQRIANPLLRTALLWGLCWSLSALWHDYHYNWIEWGIWWFFVFCFDEFLRITISFNPFKLGIRRILVFFSYFVGNYLILFGV